MTTTIAHTAIVKEVMQVLELRNRVAGRQNLAGVYLTDTPPDKTIHVIALTIRLDPEQIAVIFLNSVHGRLTPD
jgi:hypothetical protein